MIAFRVVGAMVGFLYAIAITALMAALRNPVATGVLALGAIGVYSIY